MTDENGRPVRGIDRGIDPWTDRRISDLEREAREFNRRAEEIRRPIEAATSEIRTWQAAASERERRREEQVEGLRREIEGVRKDISALKETIPNKAINDLIVKVVLGLIGLILVAVVSLWLGVLGVKQ